MKEGEGGGKGLGEEDVGQGCCLRVCVCVCVYVLCGRFGREKRGRKEEWKAEKGWRKRKDGGEKSRREGLVKS